MEFNAPGIVLAARPFGESDCVAAIFTEQEGITHGLAKGGQSRSKASLWQAGNLVQAKWVARLEDQLGSFSAELIHAGAALAMDDPWSLGILLAACAVADGALPERQAHPGIFRGLLHLIGHASEGAALLGELVRWELGLLQELGYGLDLASCAVTGARDGLVYVSPRTGRAVSADGAGLWKERLLPLPPFMVADVAGDMAQFADGLRITGRFLARDAFGLRHLGVPPPRVLLEERVWATARQGQGSALDPLEAGPPDLH